MTMLRSASVRVVGLLVLWLLLSRGGIADVAAGIVAALLGTWVSLALLPPGKARLRPIPVIEYAVRFLVQSVVAGVDVARRALAPEMPLQTGFVRYRPASPPGMARNAFTTLTSLLPGTLPVGPDEGGALLIHCLDTAQPVSAQLAAEEQRVLRIAGGADRDG
jgi:multicomponent Na+:H+ antiporter subunit E